MKTVLARLTLALVTTAAAGLSATINFDCIETNDGECTFDLEGQLFLDVTGSGSEATLTFRNEGPTASRIDDIYFDAPSGYFTSFTLPPVTSDVAFESGTNPDNLPRGQNLTPPF